MSLNKIIAIFGLILVVFIVVVFLQFNNNKALFGNNTPTLPTGKVTVNGRTFTVEIAKTPVQQQQGLSGRKSLLRDLGMLFVFEKPNFYNFWMKDMKFPIDIVFIRGDKIVSVVQNAPPPSSKTTTLPMYAPTAPIDRALEVNAGNAKDFDMKAGDTVKIEL